MKKKKNSHVASQKHVHWIQFENFVNYIVKMFRA
jgi:hypothetical protein